MCLENLAKSLPEAPLSMASGRVVPQPRDIDGGELREDWYGPRTSVFLAFHVRFCNSFPTKTIWQSGNCTVIKIFGGQLWETKRHLDLEHQFMGGNVFQILIANTPNFLFFLRTNLFLKGSCLFCVLYEYSNM